MSATIFQKTNIHVKREPGEEAILNMFQHERFAGWTVFEEPHLNSMKPDFIAYHPNKGILVIEVKDYSLSSPMYHEGGYVEAEDGRLIKKNPVQQVTHYVNSLLKNELRNSVEFSENFGDYYGCIESVIYFHRATTAQAQAFCDYPRYTKIWTQEHLAEITSNQRYLNTNEYTFALRQVNSKFVANGQLARLTNELSNVLQYADYNLERTEPVILDRKQNDLAKLKPKKTTLYKGVAGSGKTLMLVEKAIQAAQKGEKVLILTFNITLRHYIRDLLSQQCPQQNRPRMKQNISIMHFHDLLKNIFAVSDVERPENENERNFTSVWMDKINEDIFKYGISKDFLYDSIILDEGQDFEADWLKFLTQLYTKKGEFAVFADAAQDLYERGHWLDDENFLKFMAVKRYTIRTSYRLPKKIIEKIETTKALLQLPGDTIEVAKINEQGSLFERFEFANIQATQLHEKIAAVAHYVMQLQKNNVAEDITILTTNEHTGAEIVRYFNSLNQRTSHVYDLTRHGNMDDRRVEKWKFQGGTGRLKICSYHSYKGWETPNVLLVLDDPTTNYTQFGQIEMNETFNLASIKQALFISMSRIKPKRMDGSFNFICLNYIVPYNEKFTLLTD